MCTIIVYMSTDIQDAYRLGLQAAIHVVERKISKLDYAILYYEDLQKDSADPGMSQEFYRLAHGHRRVAQELRELVKMFLSEQKHPVPDEWETVPQELMGDINVRLAKDEAFGNRVAR